MYLAQIAGALGSTSGWCFIDVGRIIEALMILILGITVSISSYRRHLLMVEQFWRLESQGPRAQAELAIIEDIIDRNEILQSPQPRQCQCPCQQTKMQHQQARTTTKAT